MSEPTVKSLPLQGWHILVTRTHEQAGTFVEQLRALGAIPVEFPTIRIVPPEDWEQLDTALRRLCGNGIDNYDWLVFTSANGVRNCFDRLRNLGYDAQAIGNVRVAAIGPATARALATYGIHADLVPDVYIAEGVANALMDDARRGGEPFAGKRVLVARAAEARNVLVVELQQAGAIVDVVAAYRTIGVSHDDIWGREVLRMLEAKRLDMLTFTSSSTVRNFMYWLMQYGTEITDSLVWDIRQDARPRVACIGPITSQTAREFGLDVHIEAKEYTISGLIEAIIRDKERA